MATILDRCYLGAFDLHDIENIRSHALSAALLCAKMSNLVYAIKDSANPRGIDWIPDKQLREELGARDGLELTDLNKYSEEGQEPSDRFFVSVPGGSALGIRRNDTIVVAFRGTSNRDDWAINLHGAGLSGPAVVRYPIGLQTPDAFLHAGFQSIAIALARAIADPLESFVRSANKPKVLFCGHSLGGALALLAGQSERDSWGLKLPYSDRVDAIYTFGAPKVGNQQFGLLLSRVHFRYTLIGDPVPRVPPAGGFVHNVPSIRLDPYEHGPAPGVLAKIAKGWQRGRGMFDRSAKATSELLSAEHDIALYVETIKNAIPR